jgi:hypothetical protein
MVSKNALLLGGDVGKDRHLSANGEKNDGERVGNDALQKRRDVPRGFGGRVLNWRDTLDPAARAHADSACVLPRDAQRDGPFLRVPDGPHQVVVVESLAEGFGDLQRFVLDLASKLVPGGTVVFDVANAQGTQALRTVLEGSAGSLEAIGSFRDPERPVAARRLLEVVTRAGLAPVDLYGLPDATKLGPKFVSSMLQEGLFPTGYLRAMPPSRLWLVAERVAQPEGTVVVGAGEEAAVAATLRALEALFASESNVFDGRAWDVVRADGGTTEAEAFDAAIRAARGELVWLLRAGATPDRAQLERLLDRVVYGPVQPAEVAGDVHGLLALRHEVLLAGPMAVACEDFATPSIGREDWCLRFEARARGVQRVPTADLPSGACVAPPLCEPVDAVAFERDSRALLDAWRALEQREATHFSAVPLPDTADVPSPPWAGREPTLTLAMIAKNEEGFLEDCLRSAAPICDEIVVVDTGSSDRTVEIAERYGAKVVRSTWHDDFARARNESLDHATSDWVLTLDADERLTEEALAAIREGIRRPEIAGFHLTVRNVYADRRPVEVLIVRLFRNLEGLRWRNRIHEQITPSLADVGGELGLALGHLHATIEHCGYEEQVIEERGKDERNDRIFREHLRENPQDVYNIYKYGDFLRRLPGRHDEAREMLERGLEIILAEHPATTREMPFAGEMAALVALERARVDRVEEAERIVDVALRRFVPTPNLHYIAAGIARQADRHLEAMAHYERCLGYRDLALVVPVQDGITGPIAYAGMANAALGLGQNERAARLLRHALSFPGDNEEAAITLARLHLRRNEPGRALGVLSQYMHRHPRAVAVREEAVGLLARCGRFDESRRLAMHTIALHRACGRTVEAERLVSFVDHDLARAIASRGSATPQAHAPGAAHENPLSRGALPQT